MPFKPSTCMATTSFYQRKPRPGGEAEAPGTATAPSNDTSFVKKPKLGGAKTKKREIPEGLWTKCPG